jgi:sortase A
MRAGTRRFARMVEIAMLVAGSACLAWVFLTWAQATSTQRAARAQLRELVAARRPDEPRSLPAPASIGALPSPVIAWLDIPRLTVSVGVLEGDDDRTLRLAAGHLPDTPMPWDEGNSALAGHRDTFFRAMRDLRIGDELSLATAHGTFSYRVRRVRIVNPDDLSVLEPADGVALTLITCYPFTYLGRAPKRYVVQSVRIPDDDE